MNGPSELINISRKPKTKIKKALFLFFDWLLPDINWWYLGRFTNKIRIFFARGLSKDIDWNISLHKGADIYPGLVIESGVFINRCVSFDWGVTIKSNTKIGEYTSFVTHNWERDMLTGTLHEPSVIRPIVVGHDCWIGEKSEVLPGVTIGDYTTIGASSVITKNIPEWCLAVGNPAIVKKHYYHN